MAEANKVPKQDLKNLDLVMEGKPRQRDQHWILSAPISVRVLEICPSVSIEGLGAGFDSALGCFL